MKNSIYVILFLLIASFGFSQNKNSDTAILIDYKRSNFGENWWEKSGSYDYKLVENNVLAKAYLNIKPSSIFNQIEYLLLSSQMVLISFLEYLSIIYFLIK